jgi:hypothetical protein
MPRPYANDPRRLDRALSPDVLRLLLVAFGIVLLVGLTSGAVWIGYHLLRVYVSR